MNSLDALLAALLGVVPGAIYTWELEKQVGSWGLDLVDRVLRFLGMSVLFHLLLAPLSWWIYQQARGDLLAGKTMPWLLWPAVATYAVLPALTGILVGRAAKQRRAWSRLLTGPAPAPRAWDNVFSHQGRAWLRLKLKDPNGGDSGWVAGIFAPAEHGPNSYAAGFPHDQDLYLADTVDLDPASGRIQLVDGQPTFRGVGVLVRWDEVNYAEVSWT
jgi:hypothetical protein